MYTKIKCVGFLLLCCFTINCFSQSDTNEANESSQLPNLDFYDYRGTNVIDFSIGTSVINGDLVDPLFEIYTHFGYKRYIIPHLNINIGYNKFNLAYKDVFNEGFMSFDLNVESTIFPKKRFSPFVFAGGGINASNYFKQIDSKVQGGIGIEYIVYEGLGLKLFSDYNHVFSDNLEGKIFGASDDVYWRIACGVNYYFGGEKQKEKILKRYPSIIKTNPIISNK